MRGGRGRRRTGLLRRRVALACAVVAGLILAGCGDDDDGDASPGTTSASATTAAAATTTSPEADDIDPDGVVRVGVDLSGSGLPGFDPVKTQVLYIAMRYQSLVYDTLLRLGPEGEVPGLATEATIVDPQTVEITLRPGLRFSDGSPLDATAVKFAIERNRDVAPQPASFRPEIRDVTSVEVVSPLVLRVHLAKAEAGAFYELLTGPETMPISPASVQSDTAATQPVGAGPFRLTAFEPERRLVFEKNPDHWDAANIRIAGIEFVQAARGPNRLNALQSGAVDFAGYEVADLAALDGAGLETEVLRGTTSQLYFQVCKSMAPVDDVRVRQALNYAIDRESINQALTGGLGEPAWALWPKDHPLFPSELEEHYAHDRDKAKALLAEAGYPDGLNLDVISSAGLSVRFTEAVQAQMEEAGIRLNLVQSANYVQDLLVDKKAPLGTAAVSRSGLEKLSTAFAGTGLPNFCQYSDPALNALIDQLRAASPGSPEATRLWAQAQEFVIDQALWVWGIWVPDIAAWDGDRLGNVEPFINAPAEAMPWWWSVYVKRT